MSLSTVFILEICYREGRGEKGRGWERRGEGGREVNKRLIAPISLTILWLQYLQGQPVYLDDTCKQALDNNSGLVLHHVGQYGNNTHQHPRVTLAARQENWRHLINQ